MHGPKGSRRKNIVNCTTLRRCEFHRFIGRKLYASHTIFIPIRLATHITVDIYYRTEHSRGGRPTTRGQCYAVLFRWPIQVAKSWAPYQEDPKAKWELGVELYARFFSRYPDLVPHFRDVDIDSLSNHLAETIESVALAFQDIREVRDTT